MAIPDNLWRRIKERVEILFGDRGRKDDHAVRFRDLNTIYAQSKQISQTITTAQVTPVQAATATAQATADAAQATANQADANANTALANQASTLSFRVQSGSQGALLELIASNDPSGNVSVARINAQNILLKGSVATDFLTVGMGRNLLSNTRFRGGLTNWTTTGMTTPAGAETTVALRPAGQSWAAAFFPTLMVHQAGTQATGDVSVVWNDVVDASGNTAPGVPIAAGDWLEASVNVSSHRCNAWVSIAFYDATGTWISSTASTSTSQSNNVASDSTKPDLWPRIYVIAQAPANAAYATIWMTKGPTLATYADSYAFWHKPQIAMSHANASLATPYSEDGATVVGPGYLQTGAIQAGSGVIGNLAVDTIQVADGAITKQSLITVSGIVNVPSTYNHEFTNAKTIASLTITTSAADLDIISTFVLNTSGVAASNLTWVIAALHIDGQQPSAYGANSRYYQQYLPSPANSDWPLTNLFLRTNGLPPGTHTISLVAYFQTPTSGDPNATVWGASIFAREVKK